jgi:DNA-binding NarL/FixJ family response regulator
VIHRMAIHRTPDASIPSNDGVLRIVLADDHAVVREGLKSLVNSQPDMRVVGEAADGEAAVDAVRSLLPDVVVLDVSMPRINGVEAASRIRTQAPSVRVLPLTVHEEREYVTQLLRAGAAGYVLKRAAPEELVHAIRVVASGGIYLDPSLAGTIVSGYLDGVGDSPVLGQMLSTRERQVLVRIARGFSNKEIAAALTLSVKTVETYKIRMSEKLGLRSRVDIVRYATAQGWLGLRDGDEL